MRKIIVKARAIITVVCKFTNLSLKINFVIGLKILYIKESRFPQNPILSLLISKVTSLTTKRIIISNKIEEIAVQSICIVIAKITPKENLPVATIACRMLEIPESTINAIIGVKSKLANCKGSFLNKFKYGSQIFARN